MKYVLERGPGLVSLDIVEGVVGGEGDERLEGEEHSRVVSQQFGHEGRAGAPGGYKNVHKGPQILAKIAEQPRNKV